MNDMYIMNLKKSRRVTGHPVMSMKEEMAVFNTLSDDQTADVYGVGSVIDEFQNMLSEDLGKEAAVFFPSGTMAQQIALRIWCDEKKLMKVAYHPLSHPEIHEEDCLKVLHHIDTILLGEVDQVFSLKHLEAMAEVAVVLFEFPQREIGGQLPKWDELVEMVDYCKSKGYHVHLDGARLYECLPHYQKTAKEVAALFDSVYISFYKGFGGVTGAMLLGSSEFITLSKVWKRRYGGDLYHLYPYIVPAQAAFINRKDKMKHYYAYAKTYAKLLNNLEGVETIPKIPVCNMFHVYIDTSLEILTEQLIAVMQETGLSLFGRILEVDGRCKTEISMGDMFEEIGEKGLKQALGEFETIRKRN